MLPLDVSNARLGQQIDMNIFWIVIYMFTAVFVLILIPALTFYYESDPDWTFWEKIKYSLCYLIATIIVVLLILVVMYAFLSTAEIPVVAISCSVSQIQKYDPVTKTYTSPPVIENCKVSDQKFEIGVGFPIYVIGFMSFISWFLFVIFGGIGMIALPMDFIYDFCTRPKHMKKADIDKIKLVILERGKHVKEIGNECIELEKQEVMKKSFFNKQKRHYKNQINKLKVGVEMIEKDHRIINIQDEINSTTVCWYWFLLPLGIICLLLTLTWILQM